MERIERLDTAEEHGRVNARGNPSTWRFMTRSLVDVTNVGKWQTKRQGRQYDNGYRVGAMTKWKTPEVDVIYVATDTEWI